MISKHIMAMLALAITITTAYGQVKTKAQDTALTGMFRKFKEIKDPKLAEKEVEKKLESSMGEPYKQLQQWIATNKAEEEQLISGYRPGYKHGSGDMNLYPIWEEIPSPIPSLPEAKQVNFEATYKSYLGKVEMQQKKLSDMLQKHMGEQRSSEAEIKADAINMANRSAVVQQMGGADALMNMSEAERKAAAAKMKADVNSNPGAYTGVKDPGMNAMMQKMMSDPAYRDKFSRMSEKEKQAELQKFMTPQSAPRNDVAHEASMKERDDTKAAIDFNMLLAKSLNNMQEAAKPYSEGTTLANAYYDGLYDKLRAWYKVQYDALPMEVVGETREKKGLDELDRFSSMMFYLIHKKEAATRTILWTSLKNRTKIAFGEFNDFIGTYPWGQKKGASLIDASYTEPQVANAVNSIYNEMIRMTREAEGLTKKHKGQQEQYELMMK
jgi:uncharacterized protein YktA (UPF0223 family)